MNNFPINFAIMGNPLNWIIITLMVVLATLIADVFIGHKHCSCEDK